MASTLAEILLAPAAVGIYGLVLKIFVHPRLNKSAQANRARLQRAGTANDMTADDAWDIWGAGKMEAAWLGIPLLAAAILVLVGSDVAGNPFTVDSLSEWGTATVATAFWWGGLFDLVAAHHARTVYFPVPKVRLDAAWRKVVIVALTFGAGLSAISWGARALLFG